MAKSFKVNEAKAERDAKDLNITIEEAIEIQLEQWKSNFIPDKEKAKRDAKLLGISVDEAIEMQMDDLMEHHDWDMTEEENKAAMKYANVDEKTVKPKVERKRKENPTKRNIIKEIATFLGENANVSFNSVEITNPERVIRMTMGEDVYEITLSQKRKPKV